MDTCASTEKLFSSHGGKKKTLLISFESKEGGGEPGKIGRLPGRPVCFS